MGHDFLRIFFSHAERIFPLPLAARRVILKELQRDTPNYTLCLESVKNSGLESVFSAANEEKTLPDYWRHLLVEVQNRIDYSLARHEMQDFYFIFFYAQI